MLGLFSLLAFGLTGGVFAVLVVFGFVVFRGFWVLGLACWFVCSV